MGQPHPPGSGSTLLPIDRKQNEKSTQAVPTTPYIMIRLGSHFRGGYRQAPPLFLKSNRDGGLFHLECEQLLSSVCNT